MSKLSQIVAVEKGVKANANASFTRAYHNSGTPVLLTGITRSYTPKDDEGDRLPSETTLVQTTVPALLDEVKASLTRLFDVTLTKDIANTVSTANVVVDGQTLLTGAPVPYLLFLEKQLTDLHTFVSKLPTLDPAEKWAAEDNGVHETEVIQTTRTKKVPRNHVKAEATDKHPAQVEVFYEDVIVGTWNTKKLSGAVSQSRKAELVDRVRKLQDAVKFAREEANSNEVADLHVGETIFGYLFA